jgi:chromosome segregation ATPase
MAKRSLTDLLREEVEKSPDLEIENVQETTDDELIEQNAEAVETLPMNTRARPSARHSTPTKAELEATITELRASLEEAQHKEETFAELKEALDEAHRKEGALQQQISDLQSDLQHQNRSVHKLEKELEKLAQLKTELEQAKKAAFQLAEANEKLNQEVQTLKKQNESLTAKGHNIAYQPQEKAIETYHPQEKAIETYHPPERPIQKESEKPADFAKTTWLL